MRSVLLLCQLGLAIAACSGETAPNAEEPPSAETAGQGEPTGTASADDRETGSVGPLNYTYDSAILRQTNVEIDPPPDHERQVRGTKLLPVERAALLGEEGCSYGESGIETTCNADQEAGLEIALLDGPLSEWRGAFADSRMGTGSLEDVSIGGADGFRFTAQVEGSGTEWNFLPAGDSTILVARQFRFGQDAGTAEIARVIDTMQLDR